MKDLYFFPFTQMTEAQVEILTSFFPRVGFLNLNVPAGSKGTEQVETGELLPLCLPVDRYAGIDARVQSYLDWAGLHKGNEKNLKSLIRDTAYFREDTGLTAIQSQIRSGSGQKITETEGESNSHRDPLLFMKLAEIWDMENETIQSELKALDEGNSALFAELKGESDILAPVDGASRNGMPGFDPGENMTEERVRAWGELAGEAGLYAEGCGPLTLVTTSPAVMDYLEANADQVINGLDIESIKVHENGCARKERWQQEVTDILDETLSSNAPSGKELTDNAECCALSGRIRYCLLSGEKLDRIFKMPGKQIGKQIAVCLVKLNS
ncbi:MAG: hypothetical protein MI863_06975 [Desulfobacterales bacterium]|nr:hypothetical protein [Desulfobacterales bacterium]